MAQPGEAYGTNQAHSAVVYFYLVGEDGVFDTPEPRSLFFLYDNSVVRTFEELEAKAEELIKFHHKDRKYVILRTYDLAT